MSRSSRHKQLASGCAWARGDGCVAVACVAQGSGHVSRRHPLRESGSLVGLRSCVRGGLRCSGLSLSAEMSERKGGGSLCPHYAPSQLALYTLKLTNTGYAPRAHSSRAPRTPARRHRRHRRPAGPPCATRSARARARLRLRLAARRRRHRCHRQRKHRRAAAVAPVAAAAAGSATAAVPPPAAPTAWRGSVPTRCPATRLAAAAPLASPDAEQSAVRQQRGALEAR